MNYSLIRNTQKELDKYQHLSDSDRNRIIDATLKEDCSTRWMSDKNRKTAVNDAYRRELFSPFMNYDLR